MMEIPILVIIGGFTTLNDLMLTFVCHMMPYNRATYSHFSASCEQLQLFCFNFYGADVLKPIFCILAHHLFMTFSFMRK